MEANESTVPQLDSKTDSGLGPLRASDYIAMAMLVCFSLIGLIGNAMVVYGFSIMKPKLTSTIFILTLAGIDFISCLVTIPATVAIELLRFDVPYDTLCKSYHLLVSTTILFSSFVMVLIAVDRYFCICKPFIQVITKRKAKLLILSICFLALSIGFIYCLNNGLTPVRNVEESTNKTNKLKLQEAKYGLANETTELRENVKWIYPGPKLLCGTSKKFGLQYYKITTAIYSSLYAICGLIVIILYIIIYKFILTRRKKRLRSESFPCCTFNKTPHSEAENTEIICMSQVTQPCEDVDKENSVEAPLKAQSQENLNSTQTRRPKKKKHHPKSDSTSTFRQKQERIRVNNIKTALMLSVVALVFITAFLPAWLMKHKIIDFNIILFYMYFVYNVANPFIYAFMNPDFQQKMSIALRRIKEQCR